MYHVLYFDIVFCGHFSVPFGMMKQDLLETSDTRSVKKLLSCHVDHGLPVNNNRARTDDNLPFQCSGCFSNGGIGCKLCTIDWTLLKHVLCCLQAASQKRWQEEPLGTWNSLLKSWNPRWIEITCCLLDIAGNVSGNCYNKIDQIYPMLGWSIFCWALGVLMLMADGQNPPSLSELSKCLIQNFGLLLPGYFKVYVG